jgi:hypothetical protein
MQTVAILLLVLAAPLQRIETQYPDPAKVTRVETAMNHLTIIELKEAVTLAAAGSPSFKIERRENKVFIQPLEEGASTNLFVWTNSGRLNYELVPAESVETMHFVIDQQSSASSENHEDAAVSPAGVTPKQSIADEMFLFAKPIRNRGLKVDRNQIGVFIRDVYRKDDQLFIRYMIDNRTAHPYLAADPEVFALQPASSHTALKSSRYSQVGPDLEKKIRAQRPVRIATVECDVPSEPLPPGEAATGILILHAPPVTPESEPSVLRIVFPTAGQQATAVTLVL